MDHPASTAVKPLRTEFLKAVHPPPAYQGRSPQRPLCQWKEASAGGTAIISAAEGEGGMLGTRGRAGQAGLLLGRC